MFCGMGTWRGGGVNSIRPPHAVLLRGHMIHPICSTFILSTHFPASPMTVSSHPSLTEKPLSSGLLLGWVPRISSLPNKGGQATLLLTWSSQLVSQFPMPPSTSHYGPSPSQCRGAHVSGQPPSLHSLNFCLLSLHHRPFTLRWPFVLYPTCSTSFN